MRELTAEPCTTERYFLGEGSRWDEVRHELYWVDIDAGRFYRARADGATVDVIHRYDLGGYIGAVVPMEDRADGWLVAKDTSIFRLDERGTLLEVAAPEAELEGIVRVNDAVADPWGRVWVGSMAFGATPGMGSLFRYHESTGTEKQLGALTIPNGQGWSPDRRSMYFVESVPGTLYAFDVDDRGEVDHRRVLLEFDADEDGAPDGLCVDSEGAIWVAMWGSGQVRRYAASGELLARVTLPTSQPACCTIGGANATTLYVTTAQEDMSAETLEAEPDAGRLFFVDVGVAGQAIDPYRPHLRRSAEATARPD